MKYAMRFILSRGRPENVPRMNKLADPDYWVVHTKEEAKVYQDAGARTLVSNTETLGEKRQWVLDYCRDEALDYYVSMDDDIFKVGYLGQGEYEFVPCSLDYVIDHVIDLMDASDSYLGGCYHQDIVKFMNHRIHTRQLVSAGFMVINPRTRCEWTQDPVLMFRDDQDFSMQHIQRYGLLVRANYMMVAHEWYKGEGGLNQFRDLEKEVASAKMLMQKWPGEFKPRPGSKRPGDIVMKDAGMYGKNHKSQSIGRLLNGV